MPEAVIVAPARSPIGRASKGPLAEVRADDLARFDIDAVGEGQGIAMIVEGLG